MPRIVRRERSTYTSIILDALLEVSENISLVDWNALSKRWIVLVGLLLNATYWLICIQIAYLKKSSNNAIFESPNTSKGSRSRSNGGGWWYNVLWTTNIVFIACSLFNTYLCFSRRREYMITPKSASRPTTASAGAQSDSTTPKRNPTGASGSLGWDVLRQFSPSLHQRDRPVSRPSEQERLVAWDPSMPSLRFFAVFSPIHVLITSLFQHKAIALLITILLSLQMLYLIGIYDLHVSHKRLIYGQVFSDYEKNFVQPRIGVMKRDVGVGTRADDNGVYVEVHTPKFGIFDANSKNGMPRSASQIKMHDWEHPVVLGAAVGQRDISSPNVWASPIKIKDEQQQQQQRRHTQAYQSSRLSVASPVKINGSPAKMYRPAGWGAGPQLTNGSFSDGPQQPANNGMRRSKTTSALGNPWE